MAASGCSERLASSQAAKLPCRWKIACFHFNLSLFPPFHLYLHEEGWLLKDRGGQRDERILVSWAFSRDKPMVCDQFGKIFTALLIPYSFPLIAIRVYFHMKQQSCSCSARVLPPLLPCALWMQPWDMSALLRFLLHPWCRSHRGTATPSKHFLSPPTNMPQKWITFLGARGSLHVARSGTGGGQGRPWVVAGGGCHAVIVLWPEMHLKNRNNNRHLSAFVFRSSTDLVKNNTIQVWWDSSHHCWVPAIAQHNQEETTKPQALISSSISEADHNLKLVLDCEQSHAFLSLRLLPGQKERRSLNFAFCWV